MSQNQNPTVTQELTQELAREELVNRLSEKLHARTMYSASLNGEEETESNAYVYRKIEELNDEVVELYKQLNTNQ